VKALHPSCDPFCTIPVHAVPESDARLFNHTPVYRLVGFPRFRLPVIPIDRILTYDISIDMIIVCLPYRKSLRRG
jgi:hypothetical protein